MTEFSSWNSKFEFDAITEFNVMQNERLPDYVRFNEAEFAYSLGSICSEVNKFCQEFNAVGLHWI